MGIRSHPVRRAGMLSALLLGAVSAVAAPAITATAAAGRGPAGSAAASRHAAPAVGVRWGSCQQESARQYRARCATLMVPEDWAAPNGPRIGIALMDIPATGRSSGPVLVDSQEADGYGGSQIAFFLSHGASYLALVPQVHRSHDIVIFDPRGLGASTAISCPVSAHAPAVPEFPLTPGALARATAHNRAVYQACRTAAGSLVADAGLLSQAADVNAIRSALGAPRLDWLGQAVGGELGAVYASLYPRRAGHMVLDTVIDPWRSPAERAVDAARAEETVFRQFATWCDATPAQCPLAGRDPGQILNQLTARGVPGMTGAEVRIAAGQFMLGYPKAWHGAAQALAAAEAGDASLLTPYVELTYGDPDYTGSRAGACDDGHVSPAQLRPLAAAVRAAAPLTGGVTLQWDNLASCAGWPRASGPLDQRLPGHSRPASTVLVTATSADAINAPSWARDVARRLGGRLLTTRSAGHGALDSSPCAAAAMDTYLTTGALPASASACQ